MPHLKLSPLLFCLMLGACATSPEDAQMADALCEQGKTLLAAGKNREAHDVYASATYRDDDNARAWNGLGVADDLLGKREDAQKDYQHAVKLAPYDLAMVNNLGHSFIETGDADAAIALLQPVANDSTAPATLHQNLAMAEQMAQTKQTATSIVYADLGSYPTDGMAQGQLREAKAILGRDAKGLNFAIEPEVKTGGGVPTFTIKVTGRSPQDICDELNDKAFPCVPYNKVAD